MHDIWLRIVQEFLQCRTQCVEGREGRELSALGVSRGILFREKAGHCDDPLDADSPFRMDELFQDRETAANGTSRGSANLRSYGV